MVDKVGVRKHFPFRFEAIWLRESRFMDCVINSQQVSIDGSAMYKISKKMAFLKQNLKRWNKEFFGNIFYNNISLTQHLDLVQGEIQSKGLSEELQLLEDSVVQMHDNVSKEEDFWRRCSWAIWIKSGDHNSKFFHLIALRHKSSNRIYSIMADGLLLTDDETIRGVVVGFLENLLRDDVIWE